MKHTVLADDIYQMFSLLCVTLRRVSSIVGSCFVLSSDTNLPAEHVRSDAAGGDGVTEREVSALQTALDTDDAVRRGVEATGCPDRGHL